LLLYHLPSDKSKSGILFMSDSKASAKIDRRGFVANRLLPAAMGVLGSASGELALFALGNQANAALTGGYDQDLPYGGLAVGSAVLSGQCGDLRCKNFSGNGGIQYQQLVLQNLRPIVACSWNNRFDPFPLGTTAGGYSDKTKVRVKATGVIRAAARGDTTATVDVLNRSFGGDIKIIVRKITLTGTANVEVGPIAGETNVISNCARAPSWQSEWLRCGGAGNATSAFAQNPTIWFKQPIDPVAEGWKIGDRIGFGVVNTAPFTSSSEFAPASRWTSFNHCFMRERPDLARSSFIYDRDVGAYWQNDSAGLTNTYQTEYFPVFLVGHQGPNDSLIVKGNGSASYGSKQKGLSSTVKLRQLIKIPNDARYAGKTVRQVEAAFFRKTSTVDGMVVMRLLRAGANPGAAIDDGTLLATKSAPATGYLALANISYNVPKTYQQPVFATSPAPAIQPGDTLYIEFSVTGNSQYTMAQMINLQQSGGRGLLRPDWQSTLGPFQSKTAGGSWVNGTTDTRYTLGVQVLFT
jgi:hypothetical protein